MREPTSAQCPYCGEWVELVVDAQGASHEEYVEDCSVCCRPWKVQISREDEQEPSVVLLRDDD
jgi:hypothetical protein